MYLYLIMQNMYSGSDNYNIVTSTKLPPKNGNGQLKSICVAKKANKINIQDLKILCIIRKFMNNPL